MEHLGLPVTMIDSPLKLSPSPPGTHQSPRHLSSVAVIYCHLIAATCGLFVTSLRYVCRWVVWWEKCKLLRFVFPWLERWFVCTGNGRGNSWAIIAPKTTTVQFSPSQWWLCVSKPFRLSAEANMRKRCVHWACIFVSLFTESLEWPSDLSQAHLDLVELRKKYTA